MLYNECKMYEKIQGLEQNIMAFPGVPQTPCVKREYAA